MNLENTVALYDKFLKQQEELRRVGLEINGNQDAAEIKKVLEEAYWEEPDRFEKVKIKQRIEETNSKGAGISNHSETILSENDIKSTALEMKDAYIAELAEAKERQKELIAQLNEKIKDKSKVLDQQIDDFIEETKPITDELTLLQKRDVYLTSRLGREENAIGVMNRFGKSKISYSVGGALPSINKYKDLRKVLIKNVLKKHVRDILNYFRF